MTHYLQETPKFLSPEYWGGLDIFDEEIFADPDSLETVKLKPRDYNRARDALIEAQRQILAGNATEIRYQAGREFNPNEGQLEDGSVVIIDHEQISRWTYADPAKAWVNSGNWDRITPPIARPFSEYWANNRYVPSSSDDQSNSSGFETVRYLEEKAIYGRHLIWGVVMTYEKERRALQPFSFNGNRYGQVEKYDRRFTILNQSAHVLPISIGEPNTRSLPLRNREDPDIVDTVIDTIGRTRGIDIVYPAAGSKQKKKTRAKNKLGWLFSPNPSRT